MVWLGTTSSPIPLDHHHLRFSSHRRPGKPLLNSEFDVAVLLTVAAFLAGYVDAVAGGGGLLTVPALLLAGLSPVEAVATNKLQGTFGVAASSYVFWRARYIDLALLRPAIGAAAIGALGGSLLVSNADPALMKVAAPGLLVAIAIFFALAPNLDVSPARSSLGPIGIAAALAFPLRPIRCRPDPAHDRDHVGADGYSPACQLRRGSGCYPLVELSGTPLFDGASLRNLRWFTRSSQLGPGCATPRLAASDADQIAGRHLESCSAGCGAIDLSGGSGDYERSREPAEELAPAKNKVELGGAPGWSPPA